LYKYDGTTFTLIASNSGSPKLINDGTSIEAYFSALAVPQTTLTLTERLAIRIYVTTAGRTITLHTENATLCQVITTFTTGLTALNGLTDQVQFFGTGTAGTDFNISSVGDTHTFNIPTANATKRGLLGTADFANFTNKMNNPFSQLGQMIYSNAIGQPIVIAPNVTGTAKFLVQFGDGTNAYAPFWGAIGNEFVYQAIQSDYAPDIVGDVDGVNVYFQTQFQFAPNSTKVYVNGLRYTNGSGYDYVEFGNDTIEFTTPPDAGDLIIIEYVKL
jgi:hypothetical protein